MPDRKIKSKHTNLVLIHRILTRHCYAFWTPKHYEQLLKKEEFRDTSLFLDEIRNYRLDNRYIDSIIGNIDKSTVFLNISIIKILLKKGLTKLLLTLRDRKN